MNILETKDKLTIKELLKIAYAYGNNNSVMPESDGETLDEEFDEWFSVCKSNLLNKLVSNDIVRSEYSIVVRLDELIEKWEEELAKLLKNAGVEDIIDVVNPVHKYSCHTIRGAILDVKELRKYAIEVSK